MGESLGYLEATQVTGKESTNAPELVLIGAASQTEKIEALRKELMKRGPGLPSSAIGWGEESPEREAYYKKRADHCRKLFKKVGATFGFDPKAPDYARKILDALAWMWPAFIENVETRGRPKYSRKGMGTAATVARNKRAEFDAAKEDHGVPLINQYESQPKVNSEALGRAHRRARPKNK